MTSTRGQQRAPGGTPPDPRVTLHHFSQIGVWPVTCETCDRGWFASHLPPDYPGGATWLIYDARAIEIVRTSRLAARLPQVALRNDRRGWVTDNRGLALTIAAHHHARGLAYDVSDRTWTTLTLLTLAADRDPGLPNAALDAARLILRA